MKLNIIKQTALALAVTVTLASQVKAATVAYSDGDLLLGFEQVGTTNNLVTNIGSFSNFVSGGLYYTPGVAATVTGVSVLDLQAVFTNSWNSNVQSNLVRWGVAGRTADSQVTLGLQQNTLFLTKGRTTIGTQSAPLKRFFNGTQQTVGDNISGLGSNLAGLPSSTVNSPKSGVLDGGSVGWTSYQNGTNSALGFDYNANLEQPLTGTATGPTNSVLDLYQLNNVTNTPGTNGVSDGIFLGTFSLSNAGVLTFTAVPEPSTYALMAIGLGALVVLRRRARPLKVTVKS